MPPTVPLCDDRGYVSEQSAHRSAPRGAPRRASGPSGASFLTRPNPRLPACGKL